MQINFDDICFAGEYALQKNVNDFMKQEINAVKHLSEVQVAEIQKKYLPENILNTEYSMKVLELYVNSCIAEYHDQLRSILKEQLHIDVGEIDYDAVPGTLRQNYLKNLKCQKP